MWTCVTSSCGVRDSSIAWTPLHMHIDTDRQTHTHTLHMKQEGSPCTNQIQNASIPYLEANGSRANIWNGQRQQDLLCTTATELKCVWRTECPDKKDTMRKVSQYTLKKKKHSDFNQLNCHGSSWEESLKRKIKTDKSKTRTPSLRVATQACRTIQQKALEMGEFWCAA